jgi:hypothetical protein
MRTRDVIQLDARSTSWIAYTKKTAARGPYRSGRLPTRCDPRLRNDVMVASACLVLGAGRKRPVMSFIYLTTGKADGITSACQV